MELDEQRRLYEAGATIEEVAAAAGQSYSTTRRRLIAAGATFRDYLHGDRTAQRAKMMSRSGYDHELLLRRSSEGATAAEIAAEIGRDEESVRRAMVRRGIPRQAPKARAHRNVFWRGGAIADKHGYILIHWPDHPHSTKGGYVRQHRILMERTLGRLLRPEEVVDHRNRDTSDNRDENLRLFATNAEHLRATVTGRRNLPAEERAEQTRAAVLRAERRAAAIRQASESGADPSLWRYYRPQE